MMKFLNIAVFVLAFVPVQAQVQMLFSSDSLFNITSPLAIDSLFYWFDASQGVTDSLGGAIANNEGVGTWNDLSGHGYHVTQTTNTARPVYKTGALAGYPGIQFDGSNDFLASAAHWWGSDDITVIVVMKFANATRNSAEVIISKSESSGNKIQWVCQGRETANSYENWFVISNNGTTSSGQFNVYRDSPKRGAFHVAAWTSNGSGTRTLLLDSSSQTISETTSGNHTIYNNSTVKLALGATDVTSTPSLFGSFTITEIMVWVKPLSTAERGAMETYLNRKYDLY